MNKKLMFLAALLVLLPCANAQTQITVPNGRFDDPSETFPNSYFGVWNNPPIPHWTATGSVCMWQPSAQQFTSTPEQTILCVDSGSASNDLGVTASTNGTYTLTVAIGQRLDGLNNTYSLALNAGTTQLCTKSGANSTVPLGTFADDALSCLVGATVPSGDLIVVLTSNGRQVDFGNVRLTFTPAGHSAALTWQDNVNPSGATYNVYRSNGSPWNPILLANVSTKSYTDTTIVVGQTYTYKITAVVGGVESDGPFVAVALVVQ